MMIQVCAVTVILAVVMRKEVSSYVLTRGFQNGRNTPWSNQMFMGNDYETDFWDLSVPVKFFYPGLNPIEQNPAYAFKDSNTGNTGLEDAGIRQGQDELIFPKKRAPSGLSTVSKRIHTCAFMRRLGLPIGLCFKGSRNRASQRPRVQEEEERPEQNAYAYLERQWPVHSMLGGGVGR